jgi:hypothetical protein
MVNFSVVRVTHHSATAPFRIPEKPLSIDTRAVWSARTVDCREHTLFSSEG